IASLRQIHALTHILVGKPVSTFPGYPLAKDTATPQWRTFPPPHRRALPIKGNHSQLAMRRISLLHEENLRIPSPCSRECGIATTVTCRSRSRHLPAIFLLIWHAISE